MATRCNTKPARRSRSVAEDTTPRPGEELSDYRRRCPRVRWVSLADASILAERDPSTIRQKSFSKVKKWRVIARLAARSQPAA